MGTEENAGRVRFTSARRFNCPGRSVMFRRLIRHSLTVVLAISLAFSALATIAWVRGYWADDVFCDSGSGLVLLSSHQRILLGQSDMLGYPELGLHDGYQVAKPSN